MPPSTATLATEGSLDDAENGRAVAPSPPKALTGRRCGASPACRLMRLVMRASAMRPGCMRAAPIRTSSISKLSPSASTPACPPGWNGTGEAGQPFAVQVDGERVAGQLQPQRAEAVAGFAFAPDLL